MRKSVGSPSTDSARPVEAMSGDEVTAECLRIFARLSPDEKAEALTKLKQIVADAARGLTH